MSNNPYGVNSEDRAPLESPTSDTTRPTIGLPEGVRHQKPKELRIAYTLLCFLGVFGAHKFYMNQKTHGIIYLVTALVSLMTVQLASFGFVSFIGFSALVLFTFIDCMTLPEQLERSESGEQFKALEIIDFAKKSVS